MEGSLDTVVHAEAGSASDDAAGVVEAEGDSKPPPAGTRQTAQALHLQRLQFKDGYLKHQPKHCSVLESEAELGVHAAAAAPAGAAEPVCVRGPLASSIATLLVRAAILVR
mmetsp:Transcript_41551/g.93896  ORF Transcript_41551/g.93896 Transcript_41551/m.93896 type:complete len:111 (-) Transcript_41551:258-590(-)